jgi:N-acetylglucosaminyldiphosphoundecaprenol N-acetyl-beta-D-mannosaminyltransferase
VRIQVDLLGTLIDCVDVSEALQRIDGFVQSRRFHQVVTVNVDFLRLASKDQSFQYLVNDADLVLADGMPLVWASRRRSTPLPARVTGVDMILACSQLAARRGYSIFLLGAAPGVARTTAEILQARFPGLRVAGTYSPPTTELVDLDASVRMVRAARPDMLFVALGAPTQDRFISDNQDRLHVPVCMGVGGSFDMLAGNVRRAPIWVQQRGLEWLYRLVQEPRRLWKRYILQDLPVFARLMFQARESLATPRPRMQVGLQENTRAESMHGEPVYGETNLHVKEAILGVSQSA